MGEQDLFAVDAVEAYDGILAHESNLDLNMVLQQGDIQLVSNNHFILHARTKFENYSNEELAALNAAMIQVSSSPVSQNKLSAVGKRDLLRLWVSDPSSDLSWGMYMSKIKDFGRVMGGLLLVIIILTITMIFFSFFKAILYIYL
jgi:hypothetical protein